MSTMDDPAMEDPMFQVGHADGGGEGHEAAGGVTTDGGHGTVLSGRGMTAPVGQIRVSAGWPPSGHSRPVR